MKYYVVHDARRAWGVGEGPAEAVRDAINRLRRCDDYEWADELEEATWDDRALLLLGRSQVDGHDLVIQEAARPIIDRILAGRHRLYWAHVPEIGPLETKGGRHAEGKNQ